MAPTRDPYDETTSAHPGADIEPESCDEAPFLVTSAMARMTELLIVELEALATQIGTTPDEVLAIPGLRMMRAITATEMRSGVAARMTIGRRWLARQGVPRLLEAAKTRGELATTELAGLMVVLLGGAGWGSGQIVDLEEGIEALLRLETEGGGFAARASGVKVGDTGHVLTTALSCRALVAVRRRRPAAQESPATGGPLDPDRLDTAIALASHWLRNAGAPDGPIGSGEGEQIARMTCAVEALVGTQDDEATPWVSKAARWLASRLSPSDLARGGIASESSKLISTAVALRGVLASMLTHSPKRGTLGRPIGIERETVDAAARYLAKRMLEAESPVPRGETVDPHPRWEVWSEILETLALYETVRKRLADPPPTQDALADADWAYCRERLVEVSRSFSQPIALLPKHLEVAVTLAYLLCRVADSIEDHASVPQASRAPLMARLIDVLHGHEAPDAFARAFTQAIPEASLEGDPELVLSCNLPVVMRVLRREPERTRAILVRWIVEMARGMALYTFRQPGPDGIVALDTVSDLERYCYFVAGTVGHLLTDLFLGELGDEATPELALTLRVHAESFGMGLQLVNILKDLTEDQARRWSFIPRTVCAARSLRVTDLTDPARRTSAHAAVAPLFDVARGKLDDGMRYALAIPPQHAGIRRFCLLPLWMAARTLVLARGGDAMFTPGAAVKIPREEVAELSVACVTLSSDDDELRARYRALWSESSKSTLPEGRSAG
jgi:phytoene/squalene synthetase